MVRTLRFVPMIALLIALGGCGGEEEITAEDLRQTHLSAPGCTMTAEVSCNWEAYYWEGTLQCSYVPGGESTVTVLAPEEIAGVTALVGEELTLRYEDDILPIGPLSREELSPAAALPLLMDALRSGWLLEENPEKRGDTDCIRLLLDQSGKAGKLVSLFWLRADDAVPLFAEVQVEGETVLKVEFTDFVFCDTMENREAAASGK